MIAARLARSGATAAALALLLSAGGCALFGGEVESGTAAPGAGSGERSGLSAEAERLLETDRAFSARSLETGAAQAFAQFFDEQGMRLTAAGDPVVGPEQVRASLAGGADTVLSWEPRYAEVFAPGDWGWTWGDWQLHEPGAGGRRLAQGRYINLWKKQRDGTWKVRLDMGNVEPAAP